MNKIEVMLSIIEELLARFRGKNPTVDDVAMGVSVLHNLIHNIRSMPGDVVDLRALRIEESFPETLAKFGVTQADVDEALKE